MCGALLNRLIVWQSWYRKRNLIFCFNSCMLHLILIYIDIWYLSTLSRRVGRLIVWRSWYQKETWYNELQVWGQELVPRLDESESFFIGKWKGPNGKKVKVGKWWKSEISTFFIYCFNSPPSFIVDGGNASVPQNFCFFSLASARLPLMSMGMETLHTHRRWNQL